MRSMKADDNLPVLTTMAELRQRLASSKHLILTVKVIPKSSKNQITGFLEDGTMKLKIAAVPAKGAANAELAAFLAEQFSVARRNVQIVRGETSHLKQIVISL
jgi:uncharacterized protein (TIGR00251 family)